MIVWLSLVNELTTFCSHIELQTVFNSSSILNRFQAAFTIHYSLYHVHQAEI